MRTRRTQRQNRLLAALPAAELLRLAAQLERVALPVGTLIYESGGEQGHGYFPTSGECYGVVRRESDRLFASQAALGA